MIVERYPVQSNLLTWRVDYVRVTLWLLIASYIAWFSYVSFRAHDLFLTNGFDFGIFDYIVWNNLHGHFFSGLFIGEKSHLSIHFQLILLPLTLLYLVWPSPKALLLVQALVLGLGALPIYWLAEYRLNKWLGLLFALVYLLFPALQGANLAEFHTVPLAAGLLAFAYWYLVRGRWGWLLLFCGLAALCQEDVWLVVGMMGVYLWLTRRDRRGLLLALAGFGGFLVLSLWVIPGFAAGREVHFALRRYGALGQSIPEILTTLITRPGFVLQYIVSEPDRLRYLTNLLAPVAYLAVFDPLTLIIILPTVVMNVLSGLQTMYALDRFQYSAIIVPFVVAAAINGTAWLVKTLHHRRGYAPTFLYSLLAVALLVATLGYHIRYGHTLLNRTFALPTNRLHYQAGYDMLALIPPAAVVSAQSNLSPHLTHRPGVYLFPMLSSQEYGPAEYVALDFWGNLHPFEQAEAYNARVFELRVSGDYDVIFERAGYILLKRRHR